SADPSRRPVAFYLSDGKPTFPRYPHDSTEPNDVDWALSGAAEVASRHLPTSTIEIGTFDDVGVLQQVATLTGGTLLPGVAGGELLDALASMDLEGFASMSAQNATTGQVRWASLDSFGDFDVVLDLANGVNVLTFTAVL